jgi:two-component system sensor histidine kinase UhpB
LAGALGSIGRGDYGVRLAGRLPPELSRLRDSFNRTAGQLAGMATENRRLNEQLLTLQEQERSDLARDLHDEVGPFLFAINIDAANVQRHAKDGHLAPIAGLAAGIAEAVGHLQKQVKSMLGRLRPIGLAEFGLIEAIDNLIEFWRRRHPEIAYRCDIAPEAVGLGELIDTTVYRIVQESLSNALRHSRPSAISIAVTIEDRDALVVTVADDGQGMSAEPGIGYGLLGMSERVKALGGSFAVSSRVGAGLVVTASLPQNSRRQLPVPATAVA